MELNFLHTTYLYLKKIRSYIETVAFLVQLDQEIFKTSIFIATIPLNLLDSYTSHNNNVCQIRLDFKL